LYLWHRDKKLADHFQEKILTVPALSRTPKVTALVAAWNEHEHIDSHIRSFLGLAYPKIELILCAGGTDDTLQRAQRYAGEHVMVLEQYPGEGKQRALARCFQHATGEIIFLTDADSVYVDTALTRLLIPLVEEGEQVVTGSKRPLDEQSDKLLPNYLFASEVVWNARQPVYIKGLQGANTAITRQALNRINGLDFPARTGTDYLLAQRLIRYGIAIRHVSTSVVPTDYPQTIQAYLRQRSRWLRNLLIHGLYYRSKEDVWMTVKTIIIGMLMLVMPLSVFIFGRTALIAWFLLAAHAIMCKVRYVLFMAQIYDCKLSLWMFTSLVPLTLIDFVAWTMPIIDLTSARKREKW
jgi:cellulose synthase/poly-beta-1,6-N-acetylglucosamine synthase-like glycosyltransferase